MDLAFYVSEQTLNVSLTELCGDQGDVNSTIGRVFRSILCVLLMHLGYPPLILHPLLDSLHFSVNSF